MNIRIRLSILSIAAGGVLTGCITEPPPLPPNTAADPNIRGSSRGPRNVLVKDETTLAVERELSQTQADADASQKMEHDMGNMPGMQHGGMEHGQMQMGPSSSPMPMQNAEAEKKALGDEMKKTSDDMKKTSEELKQKSEQAKPAATIYTCPMHPEVQSDKPGKCPKCGMTLVPKKGEDHEGH